MKRLLLILFFILVFRPSASLAFLIDTGSYTGDGTAAQAITGVGFQPQLVIIFCDGGTDSNEMASTDTMQPDQAVFWSTTTAYVANSVESLDADGFTVGNDTDTNESGVTCYYTAIANGTLDDVATGSYTGDGADPRTITISPTFTPGVCIVFNDASGGGRDQVFRTDDMPTDEAGVTTWLSVANQTTGDWIKSFASGSFDIGANVRVNENLTRYDFICIKAGTPGLHTFTYTGDGANDRSLTGFGFLPVFAHVKTKTTNAGATQRYAIAGDASFSTTAGSGADEIQAFEADGIQIGTQAEVNANTETYYGFALGDIAEAAAGRRPRRVIHFQ